jgi:hypothetical protein
LRFSGEFTSLICIFSEENKHFVTYFKESLRKQKTRKRGQLKRTPRQTVRKQTKSGQGISKLHGALYIKSTVDYTFRNIEDFNMFQQFKTSSREKPKERHGASLEAH